MNGIEYMTQLLEKRYGIGSFHRYVMFWPWRLPHCQLLARPHKAQYKSHFDALTGKPVESLVICDYRAALKAHHDYIIECEIAEFNGRVRDRNHFFESDVLEDNCVQLDLLRMSRVDIRKFVEEHIQLIAKLNTDIQNARYISLVENL